MLTDIVHTLLCLDSRDHERSFLVDAHHPLRMSASCVTSNIVLINLDLRPRVLPCQLYMAPMRRHTS